MCQVVVYIYRPCWHKNSYDPVLPCYAGWSGRNCVNGSIQVVGHRIIRSKIFCFTCFFARRKALFRCFLFLRQRMTAQAYDEDWSNMRIRWAHNCLQKQFRREVNEFERNCRRSLSGVEREVGMLDYLYY